MHDAIDAIILKNLCKRVWDIIFTNYLSFFLRHSSRWHFLLKSSKNGPLFETNVFYYWINKKAININYCQKNYNSMTNTIEKKIVKRWISFSRFFFSWGLDLSNDKKSYSTQDFHTSYGPLVSYFQTFMRFMKRIGIFNGILFGSSGKGYWVKSRGPSSIFNKAYPKIKFFKKKKKGKKIEKQKKNPIT